MESEKVRKQSRIGIIIRYIKMSRISFPFFSLVTRFQTVPIVFVPLKCLPMAGFLKIVRACSMHIYMIMLLQIQG